MGINRSLKFSPSIGDRRDIHKGQCELELTLHRIHDFLPSSCCGVSELIGQAVKSTFSGSLLSRIDNHIKRRCQALGFHLRTSQALVEGALFRQSRQSCTVLSVMLTVARCNQLPGRFCKSRKIAFAFLGLPRCTFAISNPIEYNSRLSSRCLGIDANSTREQSGAS